MKATAEDRARLGAETENLVAQLAKLGAVKVILSGSLAKGGCLPV
jgi:hypothetical protein